jgi:hypothetical protein
MVLTTQITISFDSYEEMEAWVRDQAKLRKAAAPPPAVSLNTEHVPNKPAGPPLMTGVPSPPF